MNGTSQNNEAESVGLFSVMPGISQETDPNVLTTMLSALEKKEEFPIHFNNLVIESFLKQQSSTTSSTTGSSSIQAPSDGIVPELNPGLNRTQVIQIPSTGVQNTSSVSASRKRKTEDNNAGVLTATEHATVPGSDAPKELTPDEKLTMKKQRREGSRRSSEVLVKNREAAQLFRQRQKEYINNLEMKAAELTSANSEANARVELLASENRLMKEQLVYLRNFMKQAVSYSFPYSSMPIPQVPTTPTSPSSPQLSSSVPSSLGNSFLDIEAFPDIRIRGDLSSFNPNGTRPAIITTADGTSLNVNMGVIGADRFYGAKQFDGDLDCMLPVLYDTFGSPFPVSSFPVSLLPAMPMMNPLHSAPTVPSMSAQTLQQAVGLVPNKDEKDLLPD